MSADPMQRTSVSPFGGGPYGETHRVGAQQSLGLIDPTYVPIRVSAKSLRQRFNGCEPDYIRDVCKGACCRKSDGTISVAVMPAEARTLIRRGATVIDGLVQPVAKACPFQDGESHLCTLHGTGDKPFGCIASPFILTSRDTLVVRNRYRLLRCYDDGQRIPAYMAFRTSLELLLGPRQAEDIVAAMDRGEGDQMARMPRWAYDTLASLKHTRR